MDSIFKKNLNPRKFVEVHDLLGMGSFGSVFKGILLQKSPHSSCKEVAVKVIAYNAEELHQLGRELYFLKTLNSPFIIHFVESFLTGQELWIIMELCDAGSLLDLHHATQKTLTEPEAAAVVACR
jgi:serine/threonine protein kinase